MANGSVARLTRAVLILSVISLACDRPPPTGLVAPSRPAPPAPLAVRAVVPNAGPANSAVEVRILGTGFQPGATVTLGGAATNVSVVGCHVYHRHNTASILEPRQTWWSPTRTG